MRSTRDKEIKWFHNSYQPVPEAGCWLWEGNMHSKGYGSFEFMRKTQSAHRVSWLIHFGDIPDKLYVLHKCDTRCCVNPNHLFLGTPKDNTQDMIRKKRFWCKLTDEQVLAIRADPRSQCTIAREYNIGQSTVSNIKRREQWSHL